MSDLLTHVLVVFSVLTVASWRLDWLGRYVAVGMVGAVLPDLVKVGLVVGPDAVEAVLGLPFSWLPLHRLGGVVVLAGLGAMAFSRPHRRRAFGALVFGATSGLVLDVGVIRANGVTPPYLYPLSWWQPPSWDLYLSSDGWPAVVAVAVAGAVWLLDRRRG